jgi:hypothetical protein
MRPLALALVVLLAVPAFAQKRKKPVEAPPSPQPVPLRLPRIIEIEPQQVTGAYNKSAVFLYDRKPLRERTMVKERESFRDEIYGSL